jgi:hypothetical protein
MPTSGGTGARGVTTTAATPGTLKLTLSPLTAEARVAYSGVLRTRGGKSPYTWKVTAGVLPNGLLLNAMEGVIAGTPIDPGEYEFTVRAEDSSQPSPVTGSQDFKLTVAPALRVATTTLHSTYLDQVYEAKLTAWGGIPPYSWTVASGTLPPGLRLDAKDGTISGTPRTGGEFPVTIQVTDSLKPSGAANTKEFKVSIFGIRLDEYGGLADAPVPGGERGFFRVAKVGDRWTLVDPVGNAYWMLSVYVVSGHDGGEAYQATVHAKYPDTRFSSTRQALRRLRSWGFNTIGEYSSSYASPIGMYGRREGNPEHMPFLQLVNVSASCIRAGNAKNLYEGLDRSVYRSRIGTFVDAFDPGLPDCAVSMITKAAGNFTGGVSSLADNPWLLGLTIDDADHTSGLRSLSHVHPGWVAAVTSPRQAGNSKYRLTYSNATVYAKLAFRDFMKARYNNDINALNASWGSDYTTFESAGGWGSGTGLLDENGRNPWIRITRFNGSLEELPPNVALDLNAWLLQLARKYFQVMTTASKTVLPHHLVFGPAALDAANRPEVLRAAGDYVDMLQLQTPGTETTILSAAYDSLQKPIFLWTTLGAQKDSPLGEKGWVLDADLNSPTQASRGEKYAEYLEALFGVQGSDGTHPVVGIDWWEYVDKVVGGEHANFGLVTYTGDNAYDGIEDRRARGVDSWGYPTGGEASDYGDFLGAVRDKNISILKRWVSELGR